MSSSYPLTIVTPTRNQADFFEDTLESLLLQKLDDRIEYRIYDANSDDGTDRLVAGYKKRLQRNGVDVVYMRRADNGQSDALRKGFQESNGDVLTYMNSDDFYAGNVLGRVLREFQRDDLQWGYGGWNIVRQDGSLFCKNRPHSFSPFLFRSYAAPIGQPSVFFRRSLYQKCVGVQEKLHLAMDFDLWLQFVEKSEPKIFPFIVSSMRYHSLAKSSQFISKHNKEAFLVAWSHSAGDWMVRAHLLYRYFGGEAMIRFGRSLAQQVETSEKL